MRRMRWRRRRDRWGCPNIRHHRTSRQGEQDTLGHGYRAYLLDRKWLKHRQDGRRDGHTTPAPHTAATVFTPAIDRNKAALWADVSLGRITASAWGPF